MQIINNQNPTFKPAFYAADVDFMNLGVVNIGKTDVNRGRFVPFIVFFLPKKMDAAITQNPQFTIQNIAALWEIYASATNQIVPLPLPFAVLFESFPPDTDVFLDITQVAGGVGLTEYKANIYFFGFYENDLP